MRRLAQVAVTLFWVSAAVVIYVYVGYPALLFVMRYVAGSQGSARPARADGVRVRRGQRRRSRHRGQAAQHACAGLPGRSAGDRGRLGRIGRRDQRDRAQLRAARAAARVLPARGKIGPPSIEGMPAVTSRGDRVFSDANTFLEPDAIRALVQNFADPRRRRRQRRRRAHRRPRLARPFRGPLLRLRALGAAGRVRNRLDDRRRWRAVRDSPRAVRRAGGRHHSRRHGDPDGGGEDGHRVVYEGAARAFEQGPETAREEFSRKARVIAGAVQFIRRRDSTVPVSAVQVMVSLISHKALRWLSPAFAMAMPCFLAGAVGT